MSSARPEVSVVVPLLDEEDNAELLHAEIRAAMEGSGRSWEVLYVDDGSTDATMARLRGLAAGDPHVGIVRLRRNYGQTAALQAGFERAVGRLVVTLDGDLQNDPADIPPMLAALDAGYHVVCGWRRARQDRLLTRTLPSRAANWLIGRLTGIPIHDNGCTLKAYRGEVVKRAHLYGDMHRFLAPMLSLSGCRYHEVVVHHRARRFGRSKYGLSRIWKVFLDLLTVKMLLRFITHPAAWFALLGFPWLLVGAASAAAAAWLYATRPEPPIVAPGVAVLALFAASHLLLAGIFAELVTRAGDYRETAPIVVTREEKRAKP
jgi:glycosyltransferase involved in cell wall biosynthesis